MNIITVVEKKILIIDFGYIFRNKQWSQQFGRIQSALATGRLPVIKPKINEDEEDEILYFDFNAVKVQLGLCQWTDPLPLLSLLISLNQANKNGIKITTIIPSPNDRRTVRVLKFLFDEGFLFEFAKCSKIVDQAGVPVAEGGEVLYSAMKRLKNINISLNYSNCSLLSAQILDTRKMFEGNLTKVDEWVEEKVKNLSNQLHEKIPAYSRNSILHRLTIVLVELLQNVVKHAYDDDQKHTYAGVYIRFRNGLDNNSIGIEEKRNLDLAFREEQANCPRLMREFLDIRKGCLEIFVIDSGMGLTESLKETLAKLSKGKLHVSYPFRYAFNLVFNDGIRKIYRRSLIEP